MEVAEKERQLKEQTTNLDYREASLKKREVEVQEKELELKQLEQQLSEKKGNPDKKHGVMRDNKVRIVVALMLLSTAFHFYFHSLDAMMIQNNALW